MAGRQGEAANALLYLRERCRVSYQGERPRRRMLVFPMSCTSVVVEDCIVRSISLNQR